MAGSDREGVACVESGDGAGRVDDLEVDALDCAERVCAEDEAVGVARTSIPRTWLGFGDRSGASVAAVGKGKGPEGSTRQRIRIAAIRLAYQAARPGVAE